MDTGSPVIRAGVASHARPIDMTQITEREELVERVASAISRIVANGGYAREAARAAIAECEKVLIESEDRNHDLVDTVLELEAQCAAMRGALEGVVAEAERLRDHDIKSMGGLEGSNAFEADGAEKCADIARVALSPDAGRKVRDVVKAVRTALNGCSIPECAPDDCQIVLSTLNGGMIDVSRSTTAGAIRNARHALSALGWEP